jgi:hypothetical protein
VIKGTLGNPRALRDRLDAGSTVALGEKQLGGDVEDMLTEQCRRRARRAATAAWYDRRGPVPAAQRP